MKTINLKQVFDSIDYTPAPLPSAESEVLDAKQLGKIIARFAEDDAAFFNFLVGIRPSHFLLTPLSPSTARNCFNRYAYMESPEFGIGLPSQPLLDIIPGDASGLVKKDELFNLIKKALHCRDIIKQADSPFSSKVMERLQDLSTSVACAYGRGLDLSDAQFDQIKNLALPVNPVDPLLTDFKYLNKIYARHFESKTKITAGVRPGWRAAPRGPRPQQI